MKKIISVLLFMVAICFGFAVSPGQAMAQGMAQGITQFNPHPYIGVGLGAFGIKASQPGFSMSNTEFGGFVNAGVSFNDYLAVELRLGTAAKASQDNAAGVVIANPSTTASQFDYFVSYLAKLQIPASPEVNLYALLGATTARFKGTTTDKTTGVSTSNSKTKTGFTWGVGGDYNVNNQLSAGIEFVQYWNDETVATNSKANLWGAVAKATYHF